jgi:alpha-tubulin suppressor-like RCC1 family protein
MNGSAKQVINGQSIPKRRAVASLSPAKKRPPLDITLLPNGGDHCRPSHPSRRHTKSSNLLTGCRPPTKLPPLPRRMIALSQEETCLVSAAGDVMVSRGREFAQLLGAKDPQFGNLTTTGSNLSRTGSMGWCDLECSKFPLTLEKSALCNPWLSRLGGQRKEKKEDERASQEYGLRGGSTYEWTTRTADPLHNGAWPIGQLDLDIHATGTSVASIRPPQHSPSVRVALYGDDGPVLSMPSFDYSHFGSGGNDMLPASPHRPQARRQSDPPEQGFNRAEARDPENGPTNGSQDVRNSGAPSHYGFATKAVTPAPMVLFHGVPTFLSSLSQVRIQQISAHPQGSHVLMISTEALLFSYGLNDHGQLGIGIKCKGPGSHNRYVWTPTIITPLLENGGKAITCAAGESHSLVVVSTEGRRVLKTRSPHADPGSQSGTPPSIKMNRVSSSPPSMNTERESSGNVREMVLSSTSTSESVWHHQLYGFGRNNSMKIGLIHPRRKVPLEQSVPTQADSTTRETDFDSESHQDDMADVLLPHRVALHCTVWPGVATKHVSGDGGSKLNSTLPQGIFALAASSEHSAALVRRATGSVELYTWGNAAYHALGLTKEELLLLKISKRAPVPTLIKSLSLSEQAASPMHSNSYLQQSPPEFPVDIALGPYSSFVVTSKGRCLSFGISYDGMLGQGSDVVEAKQPKALQFPRGASPVAITSVSAGASHVLALARDGTVFSWGKNTDGRLGFGQSQGILPGTETEALEPEQTIQWLPSRVPRMSSSKGTVHANMPPKSNGADEAFASVVQVCAGLDCSIFVTESGNVFSCGKHSGRLGLGECERDIYCPTPLFGGLSLWHRPTPPQQRPDRPNPSPPDSRRLLKRGLTTG